MNCRLRSNSALAKAIRCALSHWKALTCYVSNGRPEMSNNAAEREMRRGSARRVSLRLEWIIRFRVLEPFQP